ncbi:hypothetical protein [Rhizobium leguminosarum]|uniref:CMP/dCMP-type deaminase domain-containing protein n=1 Tax=Rhizobium leguminosarum TaxID=384 RepID=A0A7K3VLZ5_RHILE|nr:hypothetical protein [Rhizobium leguminosarum]NEK18183.1 hypothetical protein [Rhizobium leguminosarum]
MSDLETHTGGVGAPPPGSNKNLLEYWNKPVGELATVATSEIALEERERHRIYSLLTMAITAVFWNGNKRGQDGVYPWRPLQRKPNGTYQGDRYLGHNIASLAVAGNGEIIDFDFNHNDIFNSSAEHAEARLVRRVFNLNQIYDNWQTKKPGERPPSSYGTVLTNVTIYTSLESCAQCSGIMTLGNVKSVVYLQTDPGQYRVGNMLYNLTRPLSGNAAKYGAPEPIDASTFGFEYKPDLDTAYRDYSTRVTKPDQPAFFEPTDSSASIDRSPAITSFLCTDAALNIFSAARGELDKFVPQYPDYRPKDGGGDPSTVLSNQNAVDHARAFLNHVQHKARRGTPHR